MAQNLTAQGSPTKPFGNGPKSLRKPAQDDLDAELAALEGSDSLPVAAAPSSDLDAELAALEGGSAPDLAAPMPDASADTDMRQSPTALNYLANPSLALENNVPNGADLIMQAKAGLAANDTEKLGFLQKQFGKENVRIVDGKFQYRKSPEEKFRKFNSTIINDFLDAFIPTPREAVKEVAMIPGELGGAFAGSAAATPGAGTAMGAYAGRIASVPLSNLVADMVAEQVGIPQDASRNKNMEVVLEASLEAAVPVAGKILKGGINRIAKKIPGSSANVAKQATEAAQDVFALGDQSKEVLGAVKQLEEAGINARLLNHQLHTESTPLKQAAMMVRDTKEFQDAQVRIAGEAQDVIQKTFRSLTDPALAGKSQAGRIGEVVLDSAKTLRQAEGREIGALKNKAMANTKNGALIVPESINEKIKVLASNLGFDPIKGTPPKDVSALGGKLGITDPNDIRAFSNTLSDMIKRGKGGQVRYSDLDPLVTQIGNLVPAAKKYRGTEIAGIWSGLAKEARAFKNQAIEDGLQSQAEKEAFRATNARYGALLDNVETIENLITDDMGSHIVVDKLLGKGQEALGNAKALKSILPKPTWEKLKADWVEKQILDFTSAKSGKINPAQLQEFMTKNLGPEFTEVLFDDKKKFANFKSALIYGQRALESIPPSGASPEQIKAAGKGFIQAIENFNFAKPSTYFALLTSPGAAGREAKQKQQALNAILSDEGFRRYIAGLPTAKRNRVTKTIDGIYDYAVENRLMPPAKSIDIGKGTVRRAAQQQIRSLVGEASGGEETAE